MIGGAGRTVCGRIVRGARTAGVSAGGVAGAVAAGVSATGTAGSVGFSTGGLGVTAERGITTLGFTGPAIAGFEGSWISFLGSSVCLLMAFSTSPGFEIFERSIFGLDSSLTGAATFFAELPAAFPPSFSRTRSASSSSSELEWVFFSVIPTSGSTSRICLLLTSSSRAKSLMRTFDIRPRIL
jgi:hypothetical protein